MGFDKVKKITKYAINTVDDYYRLMVIENWWSDAPLDDATLDTYLKRMHEMVKELSPMSPGDVAYLLCQVGPEASIYHIKEEFNL